MIFLAVFVIAMFVTMAVIMVVKRYAVELQFVDMPNERKVHTKIVPRVGGLGMVVGSLLPLMLWLPLDGALKAIGFGIIVLLIFGVWDDRKDINFKLKFLGQILASILVVYWGGVCIKWLPFFPSFTLPAFIGMPLTVFVLVAITNAMNLVDGLDGLAGGTTLLAFGLLGILAYFAGDTVTTMVSVAIIGSVLGFLRFNSHPASIFMGDTGSQFLGFVVALLAIRLTQQVDVGLATTLPIILLGLPVCDTLMVMLVRHQQGKSLFKPDKNHIHHRLLASGLDHYEVVMVLYLLQATLTFAAFSLRHQPDFVLVIFYALFFLSTYKGLEFVQKRNFFQSLKNARPPAWSANYVVIWGCRTGLMLLAFGLLGFVMLMHNNIPVVSLDVRLLTFFLIGLAFYSRFLGSLDHITMIDRVVVYTLVTISIYYSFNISKLNNEFLQYAELFFIGLFIVLLLTFQLNRKGNFRVSTLDFLVLLLCLTLPYITNSEDGKVAVAQIIVWLVMLLYVAEYLISTIKQRAFKYFRGFMLLITICCAAMIHL